MTRPQPPDIAIVIPARNEAARIADCLTALAGQVSERVRVILVVNNTTDGTAGLARKVASGNGINLSVLECTLAAHEGVGTARRMGCDHALRNMQGLRSLLTTDADCIVAPDWIARNLAHLDEADAVCGRIEPMASETEILVRVDTHLGVLEATYRRLVQDFFARHVPGHAEIAGTHGEAAGATLALTREAYVMAGGFAPVKCGEDRRLVRALRRAGARVRHVDDVTVQASCRLTGRAPGGMSDALKERMGARDYLIDDGLPPADWLIRQAGCGRLGPWPLLVPARLRLNVRDLPRHIEMLETFRNSERVLPAARTPDASLSKCHVIGAAPERRTAIIPAVPSPRPSARSILNGA
jgi:GT2 family glycosyltransferase